MTDQQQRKQILRQFMQRHYSDERLAMLLAHAQEGKLAYRSCCCFIGVVTADHPLRDRSCWGAAKHLMTAKTLKGAYEAENAYYNLRFIWDMNMNGDALRRRILIPMIRAEMRRRERVKGKLEGNAQCSHLPLISTAV